MRSIAALILICLLPDSLPLHSQVGSPSGQPAAKPKDPAAAPSVAAPRLGASPAARLLAPPTPGVHTEEGTLNNASFRIDVPGNWNHSLVLYYHGYQQTPQTYQPNATTQQPNPPPRLLQPILGRGYAVAQSGYSVGGWAVANAMGETDALRQYFIAHYGAPRETYLMGQSMGGLLTLLTLEQHPKDYAGGLAMCGVLAPADLVMQRAFANRVAFDAFFPNTLPDVDHIPDNFQMNDPATSAAIEKLLDAHPPEAALLRSLADIHTNRGLADVLVFNTFVIKDLRLKAGGNPFDNRNLIYTGTTDDATLNEKVRRYAAEPAALGYVSAHATPVGNLARKLLAVHTIYDPLVPASTAAWYDELITRMGRGELFVQQYVDRDGHCNITADQAAIAFDELTTWVHDGKRPTPGRLPEPQSPPAPEKAVAPKPPPPPKNIGKPQ